MARSAKSQVYEVRQRFRAPVPFVFRWCTDYSPDDARLEREEYTRRILNRSKRSVRYEDLSEWPGGWMWSRTDVTLHPPNRWHAEAVGNYRRWSLDYTLTATDDGGTELHLRGERTPVVLGERNPPVRQLERELAHTWANFARALEKEYRGSRTKRRRP